MTSRTLPLLAALALAGCFDFEQLRQPRPDGPDGEDLSLAADLAGVEPDGLPPPPDLAPPADLTPGCVPTAPLAPYIYVSTTGQTSGTGTLIDPVSSIDRAIDLANALSTPPSPAPVSILVAGGAYAETVSAVLNRPMHFYGGYSPSFNCRNPTAYPTEIDGSSTATVNLIGEALLFDGFAVVGGNPPTTTDFARAFVYSGPFLTLRNTAIISHRSGVAQAALALLVTGAQFVIEDVSIASNVAGSGSFAVDLCNSNGTLSRARVTSENPVGSATALRVRHVQIGMDCGGVNRRGTITVSSTVAIAAGLVASGLSHQPIAGETRAQSELVLQHSAFVSGGMNDASAIRVVGSDQTAATSMILDHVTAWANPLAPTRSNALTNLSDLTLDLRNNILVAGLPVSSTTTLVVSSPPNMKNFVWNDTTVGPSVIAQLGTTSYDRSAYPAIDPNATFGDPGLDFDHVHLTATGMARGQAGSCGASATDVDSEAKPQPANAGKCDVGADERP